MSRSPHDPPSGVSPTVLVAALALAAALFVPSLSRGEGPGSPAPTTAAPSAAAR